MTEASLRKPVLAYLRVFFDPSDVKNECETHELRVDIQDELRIIPDYFNPKGVLIEFDGGNLSLERDSFLDLLAQYKQKYEKDIHHVAIDELLKAVDDFPEKMRIRFSSDLQFLKQQLDQRREKKS